jgi:hypothetical protein
LRGVAEQMGNYMRWHRFTPTKTGDGDPALYKSGGNL